MKKILVTGASGNVGHEIIRGLHEINSPRGIIAADFDPAAARKALKKFENIEFRKLDFTDPSTFATALQDVGIVFLLRPPQLADIPKYFAPFVQEMKNQKINKIVFLSVQGAENQKMIPHYNLEKLILENEMEHAFLRPSYFMQNLTTTLLHEIKTSNKIFIPSGNLKITWVDARDIGLVGAHVLNDFENYKGKPYEITGSEFKCFAEVAKELSAELGREITYESPSLFKFFREKRKLGMKKNMIFVMIMLHYLPRFSKNRPRITRTVQNIAKKKPSTLKEFIKREKHKLLP